MLCKDYKRFHKKCLFAEQTSKALLLDEGGIRSGFLTYLLKLSSKAIFAKREVFAIQTQSNHQEQAF